MMCGTMKRKRCRPPVMITCDDSKVLFAFFCKYTDQWPKLPNYCHSVIETLYLWHRVNFSIAECRAHKLSPRTAVEFSL